MKKERGSAIIIAIIIVTIISTVVIGSSQIFLNENTQNVKYIDGIQAWYAGYSGLDMLKNINSDKYSGTLSVESQKSGKRIALINASKNQDNTGESITLLSGEAANYTINKLGQAHMWLKGIEVKGENCPDNNALYVYLKYTIEGGQTKIINGTNQIRGIWPDTFSNNIINLYSIDKTLSLTPIVSDKFILGDKIDGGLSRQCVVSTRWKLEAPTDALSPNEGNIKSTGSFGGITKTLYR
jgi:hypothetical protein